MSRKTSRIVWLLGLMLLVVSSLAFRISSQDAMRDPNGASSFDLVDQTFGLGNGRVLGRMDDSSGRNSSARAVAVQPDGKIILAGEWSSFPIMARCVVMRLDAAGNLDPTFSVVGRVGTEILNRTCVANDVVLQPDGKIVIAGTSRSGSNDDFVVLRYNSEGSLDTSFGVDGIVITEVGGSGNVPDIANSVALQPDGKIVVAGQTSGDAAVVRYNTDGSLDTSFDSDGIRILSFGPDSDDAAGVAVTPDGKIVIVGNSYSGISNFRFAAARFSSDGSLDTGFGSSGIAFATFPSATGVGDLAVQPDGKIVAVGYTFNTGTFFDMAAVRFNTYGTLDTSFDGDGKVTISVGSVNISPSDEANSVLIAPDGKIVLVGCGRGTTGNTFFSVARLNPDGSRDMSFAGSGIANGFGGNGFGVALQGSKIVVTGESTIGTSSRTDFGTMRFTADGRIDTTFPSGIVRTPIGVSNEEAMALALQSDGRIVAAGFSFATATNNDFALVRYHPAGVLDTAFGAAGKVTTAIGPGDDTARDVVIQPDGKIVAFGYSLVSPGNYDLAIVRYNENGSLDTSFGGGDGIVTTPIGGGNDFGSAVLLQPDGKIIAFGDAEIGSTYDFFVARYNPDGTLDTSFGGGSGFVTTPLATIDRATSAVLQPDGKIIGAGRSGNGSDDDFLLVRYNTDGTLDTTFDSDGILTTPLNGFDFISTVTLQPDGKIIAVGSTAAAPALSAIAVVRYNSDGSPDTTFGTDGIVITDINNGNDSASGVELQADGKIVIAGASGTDTAVNTDFVIVRYEPNGDLDASYGNVGIVLTAASDEVGIADDFARDMVIQPDGKIVAAGYARVGSNRDFAIVRYGDTLPPPTATFVVTSPLDTNDAVQGDGLCMDASGNCTLRAAVQESNAMPGTVATISFNIPAPGVQTITLSSTLLTTQTVIIDGYTQPGASPNTLPFGNDANLLVDINGNGAVIRCFDLASFSVVRGLVVRNCDINSTSIGIRIFSGGVVEGNFVGTNPAGTAADGNSIGILCSTCRVGGSTPASRNLVSGNTNTGILASGTVQGNYVGTDRTGIIPLGNAVGINSSGKIGGTEIGEGNLVAFNTGVGITTGDGNTVRGNSVFSNGGLGLDVGTAGITPNDNCDSNATQNFPTIGSANSSNGETNITGFLNSKANSSFTLEFFHNTEGDPSGNGEGKTLIGTVDVTTSAFCTASFNFDLPIPLTANDFVTATATSSTGNTSEFSNHFQVENPGTPFADLGIVVIDTPRAVVEGGNITYDITVTNHGPQSATAYTITDTLPSNVNFVSTSPECSHSSGTVTCGFSGLANGASTSVNIVVSTPVTGFNTLISNTASVSSAQDYNSANNSSAVITSVARQVPNTVNYTFTTVTDGSLTDMSTDTITLIAAGQNDIPASGNIGFDFCFLGAPNCAPTFATTDNGFIRFENNPGGNPTLYKPLGQSAPYIVPFASNQRPHPTNGKVHYKTFGTAPDRMVVIEYRNMQADAGSNGTADLTYQIRLYETTGVIEFVYGSMQMSAAGAADPNSNSPQIGFSSGFEAGSIGTLSAPQSGSPLPTYNGLTTTPVNNLYSAGLINVLSSDHDGSRRVFRFTPPTPAAPSGITFANVSKTFISISWNDNSTNENGFLVYRSTDGVNFRRAAVAAKNSTTAFATQLDPGTTYTFRVYAVSEGGLSAFAEGSQSTLPPEEFISVSDGDWGTASTWNLNRVPTSGDNATIADGTTVNIIGFSCQAFDLRVGQGSSGVLRYDSAQSGGLTVKNVVIDANASIISPTDAGFSTHNFSFRGNFINNGTFTGNTSRVFINLGEQPHIIGGSTATTFKTLDISSPENILLQNDISVSGNLILTLGKLITGEHTLTLTPTANPSSGNPRSYVIGNKLIEFDTVGSKTFRVGTANGYAPVTATVTALGQTPSSLTIKAQEGPHPNAPNPLRALGRYWSLTETGDLTATLVFNYLQLDVPVVTEDALELKRYVGTGNVFETVPATLNTTANTVTTLSGITDFSDWTLLSPSGPTSAAVSISGRVLSADGRPIAKAVITFINSNGDSIMSQSNPFGYFRADGLMAGTVYIVSTQAKGYQFEAVAVMPTDDIADFDIIGSAVINPVTEMTERP